jgi:hypothetical protein
MRSIDSPNLTFLLSISDRYFTILIHLNPVDSFSGGTEIYSKKVKKSDLVSLTCGLHICWM